MAPGATTRQCTVCYKEIGSASKSCKHCGITVKQKKSLEHQKLKFNYQWAAKLKKDGNICKIMNSVDLILHKLELLGVSPMLFITTQKGQHRSTKVLVKSAYIQSHPSVPVMQRLYEAVTRVLKISRNMIVNPELEHYRQIGCIGNNPTSVSNTSVSSDPASVSNTSASASSDPASVSNTSASSDPASVSNTSASSDPASASSDPASVSNTSASSDPASASSDPASVSNTSASSDPASASSDPASVSNTSASSDPASVRNTSASASSDPASVSNTSASSDPASVSNTSASSDPASVCNTSASASSDPASVFKSSTFSASDPPSVSNDPAFASINSTTAANHPASVSSNSAFQTSGTASLSNDPTPAFNDHTSVPNDSTFTVNISNVFYKPIKRKGRQIHNGKKRISFSLAALHILWQEVAEYMGVRGCCTVVCELFASV
ncbi:polycystic kidney disease protein 1-like 3 isoform X1 [Ctenopharyngodon idella]|uniref:polycystic kidney disease protein 1-like 3 isoform X1 n=2 Tax=Ctenopharyngodon idella TaxID=7959 RepID=UPI002232A304|nr:polycystic kidney disease protein 1-like 3 isoform X1 [Ctenopharyngodon idella]